MQRHRHMALPFAGILLSLSSCHSNDPAISRGANSQFPISTIVSVPSGTHHYLSGVLTVPEPGDDTEKQAVRVLQSIERTLLANDLALDDVVKMSVFLVGEERLDGKLDFDGFNQAYQAFFNEGSYPARTVVQVAQLPVSGSLVEVEVVAVSHD